MPLVIWGIVARTLLAWLGRYVLKGVVLLFLWGVYWKLSRILVGSNAFQSAINANSPGSPALFGVLFGSMQFCMIEKWVPLSDGLWLFQAYMTAWGAAHTFRFAYKFVAGS